MSTINKIALAGIILTVLVVNILRFWDLDTIPYGYHVDEYASAVTIQCLATEHTDAHLTKYPLFGELNYGIPRAPVYIYPAALWQKLVGFELEKLRAFTALVHLIALAGLFVLARLLLGTRYALITVLVASVSPWSWPLTRIAYESSFPSAFLAWGLFFYLRSNRVLDKTIAAFLFCGAMYAYPPTRVQVVLMLPFLWLFDHQRQKTSLPALAAFIFALAVPLIPLVQKTLNGEIQARFNQISIFSPAYLEAIGKTNSLGDIIQVFLANFATHLTPGFLFLKGDPSYVHSTRHFGIFGGLDMLGVGALVLLLIMRLFGKYRPSFKDGCFMGFMIINFLIAIIPSGLTNSEIPNSLRIMGGWPFTCLLIAYGLWELSRHRQIFVPVICAAGIISAVVLLNVYFKAYPKESKGMFYFWTKEMAENAETDEDWTRFMLKHTEEDYHFRYYMMNYRGDSCSSSRTRWQTMRHVLGLPKLY